MNYYDHNSILFYDGHFMKAHLGLTDLYNQTMHYGYGVFEGIRAYETAFGVSVFKAKEHYGRLLNSCKLLKIPLKYSVGELTTLTYQLLEKNELSDAYIRPIVFGKPNMSLTVPENFSLVITVWKWDAYLGEKLLNVTTSSYCRPHPKSTHIEAKTCGNYVNSILATTEAQDKGFDEALLLDSDGFLAEGSGANLFFEKDRELFTPGLGNILPGITRKTVLQLANESDISVKEGKFSPQNLYEADSAFFCGTAAGIIGIKTIDRYKFPKPWENTLGKTLQDEYEKRVRQPEKTTNTL